MSHPLRERQTVIPRKGEELSRGARHDSDTARCRENDDEGRHGICRRQRSRSVIEDLDEGISRRCTQDGVDITNAIADCNQHDERHKTVGESC